MQPWAELEVFIQSYVLWSDWFNENWLVHNVLGLK